MRSVAHNHIQSKQLVMKKPFLVEIISALLVLLFTYTAISKWMDFQTFRFQLGRSPFITDYSGPLAYGIPLLELLAALLLVVPDSRLAGLYISLFLMTLFTGYVYAMLHFSYFLPCSCGGVLSSMSWTQHLIFNMAFTGLAVAGILLQPPARNEKDMKPEII